MISRTCVAQFYYSPVFRCSVSAFHCCFLFARQSLDLAWFPLPLHYTRVMLQILLQIFRITVSSTLYLHCNVLSRQPHRTENWKTQTNIQNYQTIEKKELAKSNDTSSKSDGKNKNKKAW